MSDKKRSEDLNDVIFDIYDKLQFLKERLEDHKIHLTKLTLQSNDIIKFLLNETDHPEKNKLFQEKNINFDIFIEDLLDLLNENNDLIELQRYLDEYKDELIFSQYGES